MDNRSRDSHIPESRRPGSPDLPSPVTARPVATLRPPLLVRAYRRALPLRLRRLIAQATSADLRRRTKEALGRIRLAQHFDRLPGERRLRRHPLALGRRDRRVVGHEGRARMAVTHPCPTPLSARESSLRLVCDTLEAAGVDYFQVRGYRESGSVVGIHARQRETALAALERRAREVPYYLSHPSDGTFPTGALFGAARATWRRLSGLRHVRISLFVTDPRGLLVLGERYGCDLEFWQEEDGRLVAPRDNRTAQDIAADGSSITVPGGCFTRLVSAQGRVKLPDTVTRQEFAVPLFDEVDFPIDIVYTWVDGQDPAWMRRRATIRDEPFHEESANDARYLSRDELRYSLRSVHAFAPWVRRIHLVTDSQVPHWLDTSVPGLNIVNHQALFDDRNCLPTFNSHAIESQLHRIEGLSEHFLYFNDDMFLARPVTPGDFFLANGLTKFFTSHALIPASAPHPGLQPVSVAGINNRRLLANRFGRVVTQKFKHAPYPLRRSVLEEISTQFTDELRITAANKLRSMNDISLPSALYHYYAFHTGRAVPGRMRSGYLDLGTPDLEERLTRLLQRRNLQTFCLNDTLSSYVDYVQHDALVRGFLDAYFPVTSPYEKGAVSQDHAVRSPQPAVGVPAIHERLSVGTGLPRP
ncbi:stealth family protein [Streptomyces fractus]|uniref:stealth family protein n=1 Tax=Streptomyces fractus TaxID=641806 RepID=UPI003CFB8EDD